MGIGAGLGLGLVKGFTTAFQLEQQRRIKDEEKLDQLDIILANASVDPKAKGSQVAKLAETIKNARAEFDAKDPISLFGRPTNKVELELTDAQNIINSVEEYNSDFGYGIKLMSDFQSQPSTGSAIIALKEINSKLEDSTFRSTIAAGGQPAYTALNGAIDAAIAVIQAEHLKGGANQSSLLLFGDPAEGNEGILDNFTNLFSDDGILKNMGTNINVPAASPNKVVVDSQNNNNNNVDSVNLVGGTYSYTLPEGETYKNGLNVYSSKHNVNTAEAFQHYKQTYLAGIDITNEQADDQFDLALEFLSRVDDPTAYDFNNVVKPRNKTKALTFFPDLMNKAQGSEEEKFESVVYAIAPFIPISSSSLSNESKKNFDTAGISVRTYLEERTQKKFEDLQKNDEAQAIVIKDLERLFSLREKIDEPTALSKVKKGIDFVFNPQGGFIVAGLRSIGELFDREDKVLPKDDRTVLENDEKLTQGYMTYLSNRIKNAEPGFAEFEALRISLAFKMARAEDPSGRLSNQDIELQMLRLGGDFGTRDYSLSQLAETIRTFKQNKASFEKVLAYAGDTALYKKRDAHKFQVVEAALSVNRMLISYNAAKKLGDKSLTPLVFDQTQAQDEAQQLTVPEGASFVDDQFLSGFQIAFDQNGIPLKDPQGNIIYKNKQTGQLTIDPTLQEEN